MPTLNDYKNFFDDAPVALIRTDIETGKFLMANKYASILLGCFSVEDLQDNYVSYDFYPQEQRFQLIHKLKLIGSVEGAEIELKLPNGRVIWVQASFRLNCGGTCIEGFIKEITELVGLRHIQEKVAQNLNEKIKTLAQ